MPDRVAIKADGRRAQKLRRPSGRAMEAYHRNIIKLERQEDIARDMGIAQSRVSDMVHQAARWITAHYDADIPTIKIQHTQALNELIAQVNAEWLRSQQKATESSATETDGLTGKEGAPLPKRRTTKLTVREREGNARYVELIDKLMASIRGIWGADAPQRVAQTDAEGNTLTLATFLSLVATRPAGKPPSNVIDVDVEYARLTAEPDGQVAAQPLGSDIEEHGSDTSCGITSPACDP